MSVSGSARPRPLRQALADFAWNVLLLVLLVLVLTALAGIVWALLAGVAAAMRGEDVAAALRSTPVLAMLAITVFGMAASAVSMYLLRRPASATERALSCARARQPRTWLLAAGVGVGLFLSVTAITVLARKLGVAPDPANLALIRQAWASNPILLGLFVIVLAPLYEELLFRRVLFGRLWDAGWPWLGMLSSGLVFALAHELLSLFRDASPGAFLLLALYMSMGVVFAWLYRRTGTLWAPILAHAVNNVLALAVAAATLNG